MFWPSLRKKKAHFKILKTAHVSSSLEENEFSHMQVNLHFLLQFSGDLH